MVNWDAIERSWVILPKISGALSCIGSALVGRHIAKKGLKEVSLTSHMLFRISIVDFICSFFVYFLSSWMAPRGTLPYAAGNQATCDVQGFMFVFELTYFATAYAELAAIYWLMVQQGWTQNKMKSKGIRYGFTLPPVILGFAAAIPPLFFTMYNPALFNCFLDEIPEDCEDDPETGCDRGNKAYKAQIAVFSYVLLGNLAVILFICLLVYAVYKQEKKTDRYLSNGQATNRKNTINTAWQGVRYSSAYFVTYLVAYIILGYEMTNDGSDLSEAAIITIEYFYVILTPLMGFFNAGVYFYPRYTSKRKQQPQLSRTTCLCYVLGFDRIGERLSNMSRRAGTSNTDDARSGSAEEEEQKEEEVADEDCVEDTKITCDDAA